MVEKELDHASPRPELTHFAVRMRDLVGGTPTARFARECGITESVFRGYLEGRVEPGLLTLRKIARYKEVSFDFLCSDIPALTGYGTYATRASATVIEINEPAANDAQLVRIPVLEGALSAGPGSMIEAEPAFDFLHYRREWVRAEISANIDAVRLARVRGDSMQPRLIDRDRVFIDTSLTVPKPSAVFVFREGDDLRIKRVKLVIDEGVEVTSDNSTSYPPEFLSAKLIEAGDIAFCGRAMWCERGFRL